MDIPGDTPPGVAAQCVLSVPSRLRMVGEPQKQAGTLRQTAADIAEQTKTGAGTPGDTPPGVAAQALSQSPHRIRRQSERFLNHHGRRHATTCPCTSTDCFGRWLPSVPSCARTCSLSLRLSMPDCLLLVVLASHLAFFSSGSCG